MHLLLLLTLLIPQTAEWPTYGGTLDNQRYSPLNQVNRSNVKELQVAWAFQVPFVQGNTSFECTPVVSGGIMYVTSPKSDVYAVNAETGEFLWGYDAHVNVTTTTRLCCGVINRGVAVSGGRVYVATLDARLVALDAKTGKPVESFGESGEVRVAEHAEGYSLTSAPIVTGGKVLVGIACGEFRTRGFFSAYDAVTGALVWRWYTIPAPGEPGSETWPATDVYKEGGGAPWMSPAVDAKRGLVIIGTGNPNPDFDGRARKGDNLYTCCIVALDLGTGKLRWHFQEVKHDLWDYDQSSPPILFNVRRGSRTIAAVGAAGKTGWFYILDRQTGESLLPTREIAVPQNGHATAKTQTVLDVPPFSRQKNVFGSLSTSPTEIAPGLSGGSEWSPVSFSPTAGLAYVCAVEQPMTYTTEKGSPFSANLVLGGSIGIPPGNRPTGAFVGIDVNTGRVKWRTPTEAHPVGGTCATAGGVVFAGESDGRFVALDAARGRRLWQFRCGAGVNAAPMTYSVNGRQYIAVAAGGNNKESLFSGPKYFRRGGALFVFALPVRR